MTYKQALELDQNWTAEQAKNDLERFLLRGERPADKAMALAIQALEKQIPEKPCSDFPVSYCCICNRIVYPQLKYCTDCGQALDWSDENEKENEM